MSAWHRCCRLRLKWSSCRRCAALLSIAEVQVNLSPDSYLYRMNDVSRELYIVAGGMVDLLIEQDDQPNLTESTRSAGQVVGEMGFFFGMRHITHARAHSSMPTTLFALPKADYNQLVKLYPDQVRHTTSSPFACYFSTCHHFAFTHCSPCSPAQYGSPFTLHNGTTAWPSAQLTCNTGGADHAQHPDQLAGAAQHAQ